MEIANNVNNVVGTGSNWVMNISNLFTKLIASIGLLEIIIFLVIVFLIVFWVNSAPKSQMNRNKFKW